MSEKLKNTNNKLPHEFRVNIQGRGLTDFTLRRAGDLFTVEGDGITTLGKTPIDALESLPFFAGKVAAQEWRGENHKDLIE